MITNDGRYALISIMSNNDLAFSCGNDKAFIFFFSALLIATPTSCHLADEQQHEPPEEECACFNIPHFYEAPVCGPMI